MVPYVEMLRLYAENSSQKSSNQSNWGDNMVSESPHMIHEVSQVRFRWVERGGLYINITILQLLCCHRDIRTVHIHTVGQ